MSKGTIFYIGGFILPDKNAAAHRVINNAKALREIGYNVVFINKIYDKSIKVCSKKKIEYFGFECWDILSKQSKINTIKTLYDISELKIIHIHYSNLKAIIAYNFPAVALHKAKKYCSKKGIKCLADITEWYGLKGRGFLNMIAKGIDSFIRMRIINKKLDGLIVISEYLQNYYKQQKSVVCIPPLVDIDDKKWKISETTEKSTINFIYAGTATSEKERLDIIVKAVIKFSKDYPIVLNIVGITETQFLSIYKIKDSAADNIKSRAIIFHGKVAHEAAITLVKQADFTLIIRDDNRVTRVGFPTKFVESIACSTPVISSDNSDLKNYIKHGSNGYIVDIANFQEDFENILKNPAEVSVEKTLFHYKNYVKLFESFIDGVLNAEY